MFWLGGPSGLIADILQGLNLPFTLPLFFWVDGHCALWVLNGACPSLSLPVLYSQ